MSDEIIVRQCSPTLAGLKTGNLFLVEFNTKEELQEDISNVNKRLESKGLRILSVRCRGNKALMYLYRPSHLKRDLEDEEAIRLLKEMGYSCSSPETCIVTLIDKLNNVSEFPHEIGLFLGYPPEDVRGFIENKAHNYKCVGTWKVYGDAEEAQKKFYRYRKCSNVYYEQWSKGKSMERLTVAM